MDSKTRRRWIESVLALEEAGKTDNAFYRRGLAITKGLPDPGWDHKPIIPGNK
jgi:hypothetical protein